MMLAVLGFQINLLSVALVQFLLCSLLNTQRLGPKLQGLNSVMMVSLD